jgi:hypothetical protein
VREKIGGLRAPPYVSGFRVKPGMTRANTRLRQGFDAASNQGKSIVNRPIRLGEVQKFPKTEQRGIIKSTHFSFFTNFQIDFARYIE